MEYSVRYINVEIKYNFVDQQNEHHVSDDWTACRLNMKVSEEVEQFIEVKAYPKKYGPSFPYDFTIDVANIKWEPVAMCDKPYVYGLFWSCEATICEFYLSFESESGYDSFVAYLENLLSSLAKCQIEEKSTYEDNTPCFLSSTWNYGPVEQACEFYEYIDFDIEEIVESAAVPSGGLKILRPISILADLFTKRRTSFKSKTKSPAKRKFLSFDHKKQSFVTKLLKKKRTAISNMFGRKNQNESPINLFVENSSVFSSIDPQTYSQPHVLDAIEEENNLSVSSTNENNNSIGANSSSMDSFHSCISSHNDDSVFWSETSYMNSPDVNFNGNNIVNDNQTDFHLSSFKASIRTKTADENLESGIRSLFSFNENENNRSQNESSLGSFVTAADYDDENNNFASDLDRTPLRRKLLYDDVSDSGLNDESYCEQQPNYSQCSETDFLSECISTKIDSEPSLSTQMPYSNSVSLLSVAAACVRKRICTPYRLKNNVANQLKLLATSVSLDCLLLPGKLASPTTKKTQAKKKIQTSTVNIDDGPTSNTVKAASTKQMREPKSPSIPKSVLHRISRIRTMTMSFASASSRAISIFV